MRRDGLFRAGPLAAGAMLAALALLIGLASYYLPVVGAFLMLVTPLPTALAAVRYGTRLAALTAVVATLIAVPAGGILAAVFVFSSCAMGVALGHGMARQWRVWRSLLLGAVTFAATMGLMILATVQVTGPASLTAFGETGEATLLFAAVLARALGLADLAASAESLVPIVREHSMVLMALSAVPTGYVWAFVWYGVCAPILKRLGHSAPEPALAPVAAWSLPPAVGLSFLVALTAAMFLGPRLAPGSAAALVAQVVLNWVLLAFVLQGLGLWAHLITMAGLTPVLRKTLIAALFVAAYRVPQFSQLTMLGGMFDLALGYRSGRRSAGPAQPVSRGRSTIPRRQPPRRSQGEESPGGEFVRRRPNPTVGPDAEDSRQGKSR